MKNNNFVVHINEFVDRSKWSKLVEKSPFSTPFQTPPFLDCLNSTPHHQGLVLAIEGEDQSYQALCVVDRVSENGIQFFFSRRAIIYGGPLLSDDNQGEALAILLVNIRKEFHQKAIYIEIRNFKDYSVYTSVFAELNWKYVPWLNIRKKLDFSDKNNLLASFKYNRRREIGLALKSGLTYGESKNKEDLTSVYRILQDLYTKRTGLPLPSFHFFEDLFRSGLMRLFTVTDQGQIVGGSYCLVMPQKAIFTFYYCGMRPYKPKTFPAHLAVLAAMEYGMYNGLKYLDFMGAGNPNEEYGVRNYKLEFGGELVEEGRFLSVENKILYHLGVMAINRRKKFRSMKQIGNGIR